MLGWVMDGRKERVRGHFSVVRGGLGERRCRMARSGWEESCSGSMLGGPGGRSQVGSGRAMQGLVPNGQAFGLNL